MEYQKDQSVFNLDKKLEIVPISFWHFLSLKQLQQPLRYDLMDISSLLIFKLTLEATCRFVLSLREKHKPRKLATLMVILDVL